MAFAAAHLLTTVVTTFRAALLGCFHRLAVDRQDAGFLVPPCSCPYLHAQHDADFMPRAVVDPGTVVVVARLPARKFVRDHAPLATATHQIEERIEHLPKIGL